MTSTMIADMSQFLPMGGDRFRGAVVEDLQLPPAFTLEMDELIIKAIECAYERDFSYIPVLSRDRKLVGYVDVTALKQKWEAGQANPDDPILAHTTRFKRSRAHPYTVITPWTDLAELESFLKENHFAIITDAERKFVLGVATADDLNNFVTRRG